MRKLIVRAEVDIDRSAEDVFDYCSDHRHEPEWNPMMKHCNKVTEGPVGLGTRFSTQFGKGPPMTMECVRYDRPTSWSVLGSSRTLSASGDNRVVPMGPAQAHLVMQMELEPHGVLKLVTPVLRRRMQPMFEQDLLNIKARLEDAN